MRQPKIDLTKKTITITKTFYNATLDNTSDEFNTLLQLTESFPSFRVLVSSGSRSGKRNDHKGLTINFMRKFVYNLDKENLSLFNQTYDYYALGFGYEGLDLYQHMKDWFLETYPNYKNMIVDCAPDKAA